MLERDAFRAAKRGTMELADQAARESAGGRGEQPMQQPNGPGQQVSEQGYRSQTGGFDDVVK